MGGRGGSPCHLLWRSAALHVTFKVLGYDRLDFATYRGGVESIDPNYDSLYNLGILLHMVGQLLIFGNKCDMDHMA